MKVLVGIITKNRENILPKAIQSALDQDYKNKEIAVFDDGSEDGTKSLINRFPNVKWVTSEKSIGIAEARNRLMKESDSDLFLSLDDDAWFMERDEISLAVDFITKNPLTAAIAFDILSPERSQKKEREKPLQIHTFIGCGHLLKLSLVKEVGYYLPGPGFYGSEEKDLSLRLMDQAYSVFLMPGVHVWHDKTTTARDLFLQHRSGICNDLIFATRRIPVPLLLLALPRKMINHILFSLRKKILKPCLLGFVDYFKSLPVAWRTRSPVQNKTFVKFQQLSKV
jgi:GT2 family glycosyltransferase